MASYVTCPECGGNGYTPITIPQYINGQLKFIADKVTCSWCQGTGKVPVTTNVGSKSKHN